MTEWIQSVFNNPEYTYLILPASVLLGLAAALSSCCGPVVLGAITGYSGARENIGRSSILITGFFFMIGTFLALSAMGAVAGFIGQMAGGILGNYWQVFGGIVAILFGLISLDLLPWKLPSLGFSGKRSVPTSYLGAAFFGLALGGGSSACTLGCNPALSSALGIAIIQGQTMWGMVILGFFAIGYSIPLALIMIGISLGKSTIQKSEAISKGVRYISGVLLLGVGFYLLATIN